MRRISLFLLLVLPLYLFAGKYSYVTVDDDPFKARIYTLENGLTVYLTQNAEKPEIQSLIAVRAGSQNDPIESTGLAHYLEHIMFKGTKQYGTTNYAAEEPYLQKIDSLYEVYGKTTDMEARRAIYREIDSISYLSSKIAIANEFDKLMDGIGATGVNAFTSTAMTCYVEVIPSSELRRWAAIESDRFQNLVIRGFHTELEAVYEEYNISLGDDQDKVLLAMDQALYPELPYRQHTTLGTQEHLKNPSLINVRKFYETYYRPNNVAIILSGDLDFDKTIAIIDEYFSSWQPAVLPQQPVYETKPLTGEKDTTVYGKESANVWMGWRFPAAADKDAEVVDIIAEVLQNGKCGLLDLDVEQKQRMLACGVFPFENNDFTTFFMIGYPKDGQRLTEVRDILLEEVGKLKRGEFSEDILKAVIANKRKDEMQDLQSNRSRAMEIMYSYIYRIPWDVAVGKLDRQAKITKEDIVRVANKYFTDGYVCVFKEQGEDLTEQKVDKPQISPIEMNRDSISVFREALLSMTEEHLTPQYIDFDRDLTVTTYKGRELLYRQNTENELFTLRFIINKGSKQDPSLDMAESLLEYLGTAKLSKEELSTQLYALAADISVSVGEDKTTLTVSGLQENMAAALDLLEQWVLTAKADKKIYKELVADAIQAHEMGKTDQSSSFSMLLAYGLYGEQILHQQILTPKQMKGYKPKTLLKKLAALAGTSSRITYYGPATIDEVESQLMGSRLLVAPAGSKTSDHSKYKRVNSSEVFIAPFDAQNVYYMAFADWGEVYTPKDEAIIRLFNEYFNGSMGSVVFQEMRESRALAYSASAAYGTAQYAGEDNMFMNFIISQNDKLRQCIEAFDSICTYMPASESAFQQAKASLIKQIEQRRYVRAAPIAYYINFEDRGWDHDYNKDVYEALQSLTLDDVIAFQKEHVASRTYRYLILGKVEDLDMDYLRTLGPVTILETKDLFVY